MTIADLVNHIKSLIALKLKKNDSKPIKISEGIFLGSIGALISDL
jgi:hypothetical protein